MKRLVFGLTLVIIPGFASTTSCPGTQYTSLVGCQAFDSLLTNDGSMPSSADDSTNFAASLFIQPTVSTSVVPQETPVTSTFSTPLPGYGNYPTVSLVSPSSSLTNQLASEQVSLSTLVMPTEFLGSIEPLPGYSSSTSFTVLDPSGSIDPAVPETGSIAMIGSGLIALSFIAMIARRKRRIQG